MIQKLCVLLLAVSALFGCTEEQEQPTASGNSIDIGIIGPMTGPDKTQGTHTLNGIQTALYMHPYINNGDKINLIIEDDQNDPQLAVKSLKKLVAEDKVQAIFVLSSSKAALAVNKIADTYKTPVLILIATHTDISKDTQFISQISFDNNIQGKVAALFVRDELLIEHAAVFQDPSSYYSRSLAREFSQKFRAIEGLVSNVVFETAESFACEKELSELRQQGVQLLYLPLDAQKVLLIAKTLHSMKWKPEVMVGDGLLNNAIAAHQKDIRYLHGFLAIEAYSTSIATTPLGKKAAKTLAKHFGTRKSTYPAIGFEGMVILQSVMNHCYLSPGTECINDELHSIVDFEGIMGQITIQPNGKILRSVIINRIQGDQLKLVVKVY